MSKPVVLIAEELAPSALDELSPHCAVRHVEGVDRAQLLAALPDADAVIVRSATRIDAQALDAGRRLRVVARAGVGLDNVNVVAATERGVLVVNAPTANIVSAAEHAVTLLLATARRIPDATQSIRNGEWRRSTLTGVEVAGKVVGVVGLGRVGTLFAQLMSAFGTTILAYDPYVDVTRAAELGVRLSTLDDLLRQSDFISLHLPKTPETKGLIGERELGLVKRGVIIVNTARGGLVDEEALARAVGDGRVGGAGLDVYAIEPCTDSPLFGLDNVVATPHVGASTMEAQHKAGRDVACSVLRVLRGEAVPEAVNLQPAAHPENGRTPARHGVVVRPLPGWSRAGADEGTTR